MDKETQWKYVVGIYLAAWIIVLLGILLWRWPDRPDSLSSGSEDANATPISLPADGRTTVQFRKVDRVGVGGVYQAIGHSNSELVLTPRTFDTSGVNFIILVLVMGALGACLHGISSLPLWIGKKKFKAEWTPWYLTRPFTGAILALLFYLLLRGGFLQQANVNTGGFYGIIGLAGLFGLFSKQALDKLSDIFNVVFASEKDKDSLELQEGFDVVFTGKKDGLEDQEQRDNDHA